MAKRLTDSEKWNDDWFISLDNDYRIIWIWLLDNCSHAGICKRSMKLLNMMCNTNITEEELLKQMEERVVLVDNNWFIPKFLKFQYANLHSDRPVIVSVVKELVKLGYDKLIPESFGNDYLMIKDKSKDKDKSIVKQKKNENEKFSRNFKSQGEEFFTNRVERELEKFRENRTFGN
jgi:hypothetical protein